MSFFRKLFGKGRSGSPTPDQTTNKPEETTQETPIRAFDKFGRELLIPRDEWRRNVLPGQLRQDWNNADSLARVIIQAFQDGFFAEVEDAARRLQEIEPQNPRSASLLSITYLNTCRPDQAEKTLREHIARHGADGVLLTNLAKAQSFLGKKQESLETLWKALELDPNQDNGLGWYEVIHREQNGENAGIEALRRVAALPGSWRAQLWLARNALKAGDIDSALDLYRTSLAVSGNPTPADLLTQMSGDLGNNGHLPELIDLTLPRFNVEQHGLMVGNNLIKACIDTGQLEQALTLLRQLATQQRPDWRETLGYWEAELAKARMSVAAPIPPKDLKITLLHIPGPLWLKSDSPFVGLFPKPALSAPRIVVSGSTFEAPKLPTEIVPRPTDGPGRISRALPLFISEHLYFRCGISSSAQIPWLIQGGFILAGAAMSDEDAIEQGRMTNEGKVPDYVITCHLVVRGENWTSRIRLIRSIDAHCVREFSYPFAEGAFHLIAAKMLNDLSQAIYDETDIISNSAKPTLEGSELDHYLFRLEQCLAACCCNMKKVEPGFLSNPAEILDGVLQLCLSNPTHAPSRLLLCRTVRAIKEIESDLVLSMASKFTELMTTHPLSGPVHRELEREIRDLLS